MLIWASLLYLYVLFHIQHYAIVAASHLFYSMLSFYCMSSFLVACIMLLSGHVCVFIMFFICLKVQMECHQAFYYIFKHFNSLKTFLHTSWEMFSHIIACCLEFLRLSFWLFQIRTANVSIWKFDPDVKEKYKSRPLKSGLSLYMNTQLSTTES